MTPPTTCSTTSCWRRTKDFATQVLPTFRPDKILHVENDEYPVYLQKLGAAAGVYIRTLDDVKTALKQRLDYFASCGCRLSDQSFGSPTSPSGTRKPPKRP